MAQKYTGISMGLSIANTAYTLIAGARTHTMTVNNEKIDVSDKDSNRWGEVLAAGKRELTISMEGWVTDDAQFALIETAIQDDTVVDLQLAYGNSKTVTGDFHIDSFSYTGEFNGAQSFTCQIVNDDTPTFA